MDLLDISEIDDEFLQAFLESNALPENLVHLNSGELNLCIQSANHVNNEADKILRGFGIAASPNQSFLLQDFDESLFDGFPQVGAGIVHNNINADRDDDQGLHAALGENIVENEEEIANAQNVDVEDDSLNQQII
ncbi:uncharacterized protein LOC130665732 [Microplitis mediator]|uniref:uncharacterized protein LOC130665732 n=1 Tax=Microplitis mediator TaxID=375433 RepID=UPI002553E670|nr:uncharacterized protein LOC130665732 [Microplitis mediator]